MERLRATDTIGVKHKLLREWIDKTVRVFIR